jgi:peptide deformylase
LEGCLSLPHLRVNVIRPHKITIEATDIEGNIFVQEFEGINARTRMHENDHLNGVLHIDRTDPKTRNEIEPILREMKKKYISPTS